MELKRQLGLTTAVLIIIADVIGTGIFMTTGEALAMTGSALGVLALFAVGGVIAVTGSLCYAELAAMWPDDGGEFVYLRRMFGPLPSFLTGWVSLFIAFSLAASMSAITAVNYINKITAEPLLTGIGVPLAGAGIVVIFSVVHALGVQRGSAVQNFFTVLKIVIVFAFIALGFSFADWGAAGRLTAAHAVPGGGSVLSYGSALIIIMYAYSGWNGSTYIAGEIKDPARNLPRALFWGAVAITLIYLALNAVYLLASPGADIIANGRYTIGALTAENLFGKTVGPYFNIAIVIILVSSVSVQMMIGPRVTYAMARERAIFSALERVNPRLGTPDLAILVQTAIAVFYVFIGFDAILKMLIYMGFALSVFPFLTVAGMMHLRITRPDMPRPFRVPFFPAVPLIYLALSAGVIVTTLIEKTVPSLFALGALALGALAYLAHRRFSAR
ncbi:MAG TPA: amino acid permease [Spirochaetota bacterium]|nr:amino acid permease [Spirochaetota bacterium]HOS40203.1 amino acid permease [Spirochaetota bacterium]HPU89713.1 amino acid permease [Spirochaetota bacterium]